MLLTMPDLRWTVYVHRWTWIYTFTRVGSVSWRDAFNGMTGRGNWRIESDKLITRWFSSKTWEEWNVPIDPNAATGQCHMTEGTYPLRAVAQNYFLQPGDDVSAAGKQYVVYPDEVRSGGTLAWVCRNPGAIREGDRYGAYKGKKYHTKSNGVFAIFPDETTGLMAVISVLRSYGRVTINQAMHKYAPQGDGINNPDNYARTLAAGLKVPDSTYLNTFSDEQMMRMADLITGVETTRRGETYARDDERLPVEIRGRLVRSR